MTFSEKGYISFDFNLMKSKLSGSTDDSVSFQKQPKLHLYRYIPGSLAPCQKLVEILSDDLRLFPKW